MLELEEKHSKHWKKATAGTLLAAVVFFLVFIGTEDPFLAGIFRMAAFIFFSAAVICSLKVMEGRHRIKMETEDGFLVVTFHKNQREIQRDLFELKNISDVQITRLPSSVFSNGFFIRDMQLELNLHDSDSPLKLLEVNGRNLSLTKTDAQKAVNYLQNAITVNNP